MRFETVRQSSTVINQLSTIQIDSDTKAGVVGSGEVEVNGVKINEVENARIKSQTVKSQAFGMAFSPLQQKFYAMIHLLKADCLTLSIF